MSDDAPKISREFSLLMDRSEIKDMYNGWMIWARLIGLSLRLGDARGAKALAEAALLYSVASTMMLGIQYGPRVAP